jgi:hypothetical protein
MVVNEIFNKFSTSVIKNDMKLTNEEKEFFYQNIAMTGLRHTVSRVLEV